MTISYINKQLNYDENAKTRIARSKCLRETLVVQRVDDLDRASHLRCDYSESQTSNCSWSPTIIRGTDKLSQSRSQVIWIRSFAMNLIGGTAETPYKALIMLCRAFFSSNFLPN